jgi:hypothetical protein
MSYRLTEHEAKAIGEALASLEAVANQMQARLSRWASITPGAGTQILGLLLALSRNVDTLERVCSDLAGILNRPPVEPDPIPPSQQEAA